MLAAYKSYVCFAQGSENSLLSTQQYYWNFVSYSLNAASGREPASCDCFFPFEWERWSTYMMSLVPCMKNMQRQGLVCMLLNECFSFSLPPCHVLSEDNNVEGGCFLLCFPTLICFLFLSNSRVHLECRR